MVQDITTGVNKMGTKAKENLYFISLNLMKDKHKDLIEWIKQQSSNNEQSLSAFCISIIKKYKESGELKEHESAR